MPIVSLPLESVWACPIMQLAEIAAADGAALVRLLLSGLHRPLYTCSYSTHSAFGNQFHADFSLRIDIFQVEDKLGKIFNRINIMMWWRRNKSYSGY